MKNLKDNKKQNNTKRNKSFKKVSFSQLRHVHFGSLYLLSDMKFF